MSTAPNSSHPEDQSDIPALQLPEGGFQSRIPAHLLVDKTEDEKFILTELGRISHFTEWAGTVLVDLNKQARRTNGRVIVLEAEGAVFKEDRKFLKRGWQAVVTIVAALAALLSLGLHFYSTFNKAHP